MSSPPSQNLYHAATAYRSASSSKPSRARDWQQHASTGMDHEPIMEDTLEGNSLSQTFWINNSLSIPFTTNDADGQAVPPIFLHSPPIIIPEATDLSYFYNTQQNVTAVGTTSNIPQSARANVPEYPNVLNEHLQSPARHNLPPPPSATLQGASTSRNTLGLSHIPDGISLPSNIFGFSSPVAGELAIDNSPTNPTGGEPIPIIENTQKPSDFNDSRYGEPFSGPDHTSHTSYGSVTRPLPYPLHSASPRTLYPTPSSAPLFMRQLPSPTAGTVASEFPPSEQYAGQPPPWLLGSSVALDGQRAQVGVSTGMQHNFPQDFQQPPAVSPYQYPLLPNIPSVPPNESSFMDTQHPAPHLHPEGYFVPPDLSTAPRLEGLNIDFQPGLSNADYLQQSVPLSLSPISPISDNFPTSIPSSSSGIPAPAAEPDSSPPTARRSSRKRKQVSEPKEKPAKKPRRGGGTRKPQFRTQDAWLEYHNGEVTYRVSGEQLICSCGNLFAREDNWRRHRDKRELACYAPGCEELQFSRRDALQRHMTQKHGREPRATKKSKGKKGGRGKGDGSESVVEEGGEGPEAGPSKSKKRRADEND